MATSEYQIDSSWFSSTARDVPRGWQITGVSSDSLAYRRVTVSADQIVLFTTDDDTVTFTRTGSGPTAGWRPPVDVDDVLSVQPDGRVTVQSPDGTTYQFAPDGSLTTVTAAASGTGTQRVYSGTPAKLTAMVDPVSGRQVTLTYEGGACPTPPSGFSGPPPGSRWLCQVGLPDGTWDRFWYDSYGQLTRIEGSGGDLTDFAYSTGRLSELRDPLVADTIAAGTAGGFAGVAVTDSAAVHNRDRLRQHRSGHQRHVTGPGPHQRHQQ